jgi:N-carbamoyl-L-amino-acid hydrolase
MVFAPSVGGVSHTEDEFTEWEDVVTGTNVLLNATLEKANEPVGGAQDGTTGTGR